MSETAFTVGFVTLIFLVPLALYLFTHYEVPESFGLSLRRTGEIAIGTSVLATIVNIVRFGLAFESWDWAWAGGSVVGAALALSIDWLVQRRRKLGGKTI